MCVHVCLLGLHISMKLQPHSYGFVPADSTNDLQLTK